MIINICYVIILAALAIVMYANRLEKKYDLFIWQTIIWLYVLKDLLGRVL